MVGLDPRPSWVQTRPFRGQVDGWIDQVSMQTTVERTQYIHSQAMAKFVLSDP